MKQLFNTIAIGLIVSITNVSAMEITIRVPAQAAAIKVSKEQKMARQLSTTLQGSVKQLMKVQVPSADKLSIHIPEFSLNYDI